MTQNPLHERRVTLLDLLDRILATGVVASGDLTISVADVDLLYLGLRAMLTSADRAEELRLLPERAPSLAPPPPEAPLPPIPPAPWVARGDATIPEVAISEIAAGAAETATRLPQRLNADPENVERGLAQLVLTLVELLRQLMERQAMRRVEAGTLSDAEIERLGQTFLRLQGRMQELKAAFGLKDEDLNLNLGPLGDLL